jgi:CHAT domain-containing protein/Tfp pilus assembly protein PilF
MPKDTIKAWSLHQQAKILYDSARYNESADLFLNAAMAYNKAGYAEKYLKNRMLYFNAVRMARAKVDLNKIAAENLVFALKKFGENHVLTADCYNNMGNVMDDYDLIDSALYYFRKAACIKSTIFGENNGEVANCYINIGIMLNQKGLFDSAQYFVRKGLDIKIAENGENHPDVAKCYNTLGVLNFYKGTYEEAEKYFRKSIEIKQSIFGNDHPLTADGYNNLGGALEKEGKYNDALEAHFKALQIRKNKLHSDHPNIALSYNNIGIVCSELGEFEISNQYYKKALEIRNRILSPNHIDFAQTYTNMAVNCLETGDCENAMKLFRKSEAIIINVFGHEHPKTSDAFNNMGSAFHCLGMFDSALVYFKKALEIRKKLNIPTGIANSYNNIGACYKEKGDYDLALSYYQQAAEILKTAFSYEHSDLASQYNNISESYLLKKDYEHAYEYVQKARDIIIHQNSEKNTDWINQLNLSAIILSQKGDLEGEAKQYWQAVDIAKHILGDNNYRLSGLYQNIAINYRERNLFDSAMIFIEKALALNKLYFPEKHPERAEVYKAVAEIYHYSGHPDSAITYCTKSLQSNYNGCLTKDSIDFTKIFDELLFLDVLTARSESGIELYKISGSKASLIDVISDVKTASELAFILLNNYNLDESKLIYVAELAEKYKNAVFAGIELFKYTNDSIWLKESFIFSEKAKAGILKGSMIKSNAMQQSDIPDSLLIKDRNLINQIAYVKNRILNCAEELSNYDSCYNLYAAKVNSLAIELKNTRDRMQLNDNNGNVADYLNTEMISDITSKIAPDKAIIEYCIQDSSIIAFILKRNKFSGVEIPVNRNFFGLITDYIASVRKYDPKNVLPLAHQLYSILMQPVEKYIMGVSNLVIIPDEQLLYLPFETLICSYKESSGMQDFTKQDYLINKYLFTYHYSVSLWKESENTNNRQDEYLTFAGYAPVFSPQFHLQELNAQNEKFVYNNGIDNSRSVVVSRNNLAELPNSKTEVDSIARLFILNGKKASAFLYGKATEKNFKDSAMDFSIVHVATHGLINNNIPELSGLAFAQCTEKNTNNTEIHDENDGILYASEIYNLTLLCNLIVLSACETGSGKLEKGEGIMGLTRCFLHAGAKNLVFSYWKVSDSATIELMLHFYNQLLAGDDYATALRKAKLHLIQNSQMAYPAFWGTFAFIGN